MPFVNFLDQFTSSPISPAYADYLPLNIGGSSPNLPSPVQLDWPTQTPYSTTPFSNNMFIITNSSSSNIIKLPNATLASISKSSILNNISGTNVYLQDFLGGSIGTITATSGLSYYLLLTNNTTEAGSWTLIPFGTASMAPIEIQNLVDSQASTVNTNLLLQGGLAVVNDTEVATPGDYLKVNMRVQNYPSSLGNYQQSQGDRGTLLVVTGASSIDYNLISAAQAGNGFIFSINNTMPNGGGGKITLKTAGLDTIDQDQLLQSNSCSFVSDGVNKWTSLGFGLNTVPLNFSDVTVSLAAGSNTAPPLNFFNDTTRSLGLFYNSSGNPSMQIVQSYYNPGVNGVVIADFYTSETETLGFVTLATNSTFSGTIASLFGSTFNSSTANLFGSTFTTALVDINATGNIGITSSAGGVTLTSNGILLIESTNNDVQITGIDNVLINATSGFAEITCAADMTLTADENILIVSTTNNVNITSTLGNVGINSAATTTLTSTNSVNNATPNLQQNGISIYSLARAYL